MLRRRAHSGQAAVINRSSRLGEILDDLVARASSVSRLTSPPIGHQGVTAEISDYFRPWEITSICADCLVELSGFELRTSLVQAPACVDRAPFRLKIDFAADLLEAQSSA